LFALEDPDGTAGRANAKAVRPNTRRGQPAAAIDKFGPIGIAGQAFHSSYQEFRIQ